MRAENACINLIPLQIQVNKIDSNSRFANENEIFPLLIYCVFVNQLKRNVWNFDDKENIRTVKKIIIEIKMIPNLIHMVRVSI